jgi:hypothetical protein
VSFSLTYYVLKNSFDANCTFGRHSEMVTFSSGFFSSILAAAMEGRTDHIAALKDARIIHGVITGIVDACSLVVSIARDMENIAIRMVVESTVINLATKAKFLRNMFYADESGKQPRQGTNGASKTHEWFLKAVMGTRIKSPRSSKRS